MKIPPSAIIIPNDLGDRVHFIWQGQKYELPPEDGYCTVRNGWQFFVSWKDRGWIAPGLFYDGGYIIHVVAVILQ